MCKYCLLEKMAKNSTNFITKFKLTPCMNDQNMIKFIFKIQLKSAIYLINKINRVCMYVCMYVCLLWTVKPIKQPGLKFGMCS